MVKRSADDILSEIHSRVDAGRAKLDSKRRSRMTLADRVALAEKAWQRGQRTRSDFAPPSRILGKWRAVLKRDVLKPMENSTMDFEEFFEWVAENWDAIGAQYFAKSKKYPDNPAFPWLVTCLEAYTNAFQQREYLDLTGTRSKVDLMRQAAGFEQATHQVEAVAGAAQSKIAALEAELKEANKRLREAKRTGKVKPTTHEKELMEATKGIKYTPVSELPDYDDFDEDGNLRKQAPKRRKLRK